MAVPSLLVPSQASAAPSLSHSGASEWAEWGSRSGFDLFPVALWVSLNGCLQESLTPCAQMKTQ